MSLKQTNCSSCNIFDPCFQVCCVGIYLCRDCLLDDTILNEYYLCPVCNRQLAGAYRPLIMMAQYNEMPYDRARNSPQQFGYNSNHPSKSNDFFRGNHQFQNPSQEEDFKFDQNLTFENTQVKRNRNTLQFSAPIANNNFNPSRQNFKHNPQQNNFSNNPINPMLAKCQSIGNLNRPFNQFSNPNSQQTNLFNEKPNFKNAPFNSNIQGFNPQNQADFGYHHQNQPYMNQQFSQNQNHAAQRVSGNGFTQNIRRNKQENNVFPQNRYQNLSSENNRYQHNTIFSQNNVMNPFSANQQGNSNIHANNFNGSFANQNMSNYGGNSSQNNERMVKSAVKMKRENCSPGNGKKSSFKVIESNAHSSKNLSTDEKNLSSERDLSPTFGFESNDLTLHGQAQDFNQRGNQMGGFRAALKEETHEVFKMRRSNSEYTLGSGQ